MNKPGKHDLVAECIRTEISVCDACGSSLHPSHAYVVFSSTIADKARLSDVTLFLEAVSKHDWESLSKFNEWSGGSNNVLACVVRCPVAGGMVVAVRDPFELYENPSVHKKVLISPNELETMTVLGNKDWQPL